MTLLHGLLALRLAPELMGEGASDAAMRRIEVSFVRELAPTAPVPVVVVRESTQPRVLAAAAAASAAPAAAEVVPEPDKASPPPEPVPEPPPKQAATLPEEPPVAVAPRPAQASELPDAPAAASGPVAAGFEWPPSTRLSYRLTGNYNGPVEGQAQVEWLRSGSRYQVHLEISVGPFFAPLVSRRLSSEGEITERGLEPRRYDEETKALLRSPRRRSITFDAERVHLPDGRKLPRPAGLQDSASQFVQLTWMFTLDPQRLRPGQSIEIPLALPRHMEVWTYDVGESETLNTPAGPVVAVHVKPRREPGRGGDLTAEVWFAPALQYLPIRILIRQDAENFVDLLVERLPQQALPAGR